MPICILLATLYAAIEQSITALGEARTRSIAENEGPYRHTAERLLRDETSIRARLLAGRVICLCVATVLVTMVVGVHGLEMAVLAGIAVAFVNGLMLELVAVFAGKYAGVIALPLLRWTRLFELIMLPWALPLALLGGALERVLPNLKDPDAQRLVDLEVESVIEKGEESGALDSSQAELLRGVLEFKDTVVREIMVPRTRMVAIEAETSVDEIVALIERSGYSRYPVYRGRVDAVVGVLYAKDFFRALGLEKGDKRSVDIMKLLRRPVFFVAESQKIGVILKEMQQKRVHLAVVADDYGGTAGIVSLEDILEEIVGEIQDEHDPEESRISKVETGRFLVDASLSVYDLEDAIGYELPDDDGDYDSVGGLVVELAGRVPAQGESVTVGELELIVRESDKRRVRRVEVVHRTEEEVAASAATE